MDGAIQRSFLSLEVSYLHRRHAFRDRGADTHVHLPTNMMTSARTIALLGHTEQPANIRHHHGDTRDLANH